MKIFADLHIHSHYSRATSGQMNIEHLSSFGKRKGLNLIGTGDFSHPMWFKELREKLVKDEKGIFTYNGMNFLLSNEISLMYSQGGKGRKVHLVVLSPDFDTAEKITEWLKTKGRVDYDGRPIFGMSCPEFTEKVMEISEDNFIIPAHAWTPWFGIFGSMSGFDSLKECFLDTEKHIHAIETGLSSDPGMNWRLSSLDKYALISNSDSHSPWPSRIGRECNVFEMKDLTYRNIISAIKSRDARKFLYTIEVDPSYGKYHFDGHRACNISLEPSESIKRNNICPVCGKPLTIGVLHRVEELADRPEGHKPENAIPFRKILPLAEIIAGKYRTSPLSKKAVEIESRFIEKFGSELNALLEADEQELAKVNPEMACLIMKNREEKIEVIPGYDGVYGIPLINGDEREIMKSRAASQEDKKKTLKEKKPFYDKKSSVEKKHKGQKSLMDFD